MKTFTKTYKQLPINKVILITLMFLTSLSANAKFYKKPVHKKVIHHKHVKHHSGQHYQPKKKFLGFQTGMIHYINPFKQKKVLHNKHTYNKKYY